MNKKGITTVVAVVLVCIFVCTPTLACYNWHGFPMQGEEHPQYGNGTVANGTVFGGVYFDGGHGLTGEMPYTQTFSVPTFDKVRFAHLYVHVWGGTENYHGWINTTFNGHSLENITLLGDDDVPPGCNKQVWCSSHGTYFVWYNVTDLVTSGTNTATAVTGKISSGSDGRVGTIELIVVYEKAGMDETRYWVAQGHDALSHATSGYAAKDYGYAYFNGTIDPANWGSVVYYASWMAGDQGDTDTLWFNDNLLCVGCTNYEQGPYWDFKIIEVKNASINYLRPTNNYARYWRDGDNYVHWLNAVLVLSREVKPDLIVEKIKEPLLPYHDYTLAVVANHTYKLNATVKNIGTGAATNASTVTLHAGADLIGSQSVPSLNPGASKELQFTWTPSLSGVYTLKATADASNQVNESDETNNIRSKDIEVLPEGQPDLAISQRDIKFLPTYAWHIANNKTTIRVNVTNNGTGDASNFDVRLFVDSLQTNNTVLSVDAKAVKVTSFVYDAPKGGPYDVKVVLDADGEVTESNETNNETSRPLKVIEVRIRDTHHYGNATTYNGKESGWKDVAMFDVVKLVPENTTPWDALNSVAVVKPHPLMMPGKTFVYGIDGLDEDPTGPIYWYLYMNGRYVPNNMLCGEYPLQDGETAHWDFQKHVYGTTESFTPPCTVQSYIDLYPEPFTHGYWGTEWNTTIVYPAESPDEYLSIANNIRNKLVSRGVPGGRIDIDTDSNVIAAEKRKTNNLILLGAHTANDIVYEINPYHEYFGMVVYFSAGKMIDDCDDKEYNHGGVVQAFDNPYDNGYLGTNYSWNVPGPVIFMASGLNDSDAKNAAELLVNRTDELNRFWKYIECAAQPQIFDTEAPTNPYPSIFGTHNGTITPNKNISVNYLYTYPCTGTGGHTEFAMIWNETTGDHAEAHWDGYIGDYHNMSFNTTLTLRKGVIYNYTIRTGSYPQIHHTPALPTATGWINCTKFTDANGRDYNNWIPAIKLFYEV